jgi:phosphoglucomutase
MSVHPQAGQVASRDKLANIPLLCSEYYVLTPDVSQQAQRVSFGTSGHRGNASQASFNEWHIKAICQAVSEYRAAQGVQGPLFLGKDTHALSEPAFLSAVQVFIANGVQLKVQMVL